MKPEPLWEFGFGLSYTRFEYAGLEIQPARIQPDGTVRVRATVRNAGNRGGSEVVQLYLRDPAATVV